MPVEKANQFQLAFVAETVFGTTPDTPTGQVLRQTSVDFGIDAAYIANPELRQDAMVQAGRRGALKSKGSIKGVLSHGTYDDFFAAALGNTWSSDVLKVGSTGLRPSFTLEQSHEGNGFHFPFTGCVVDGFSLSGKVNAAVDVAFEIIAKGVGAESATSIFAYPTAANSNPLITSWDGSVKVAGATLGNVVGWDLKVARNSGSGEVVGTSDLYDIQHGSCAVSGSLEVYFDSLALYNDFRNETDVAIQINLGTGTGNTYTLDMTRCRIKTFKKNGGGKDGGLLTATVEFESYVPSTGTNTSLKITR